MRNAPILALLASVFLFGPPTAAPAAVFIAEDALDLSQLIPPPPDDNSPAGRADLETVLQLQAERTPAHLARIERVARQTVFTFASPVLGAWFTAENLPRTDAHFKIITAESYAVTLQGKRFWTRPRPYLRDERVQPHPTRSRSQSYPSGHSSDAATWAEILSTLFPEHTAAFASQVRESMWGRVLGGSHYPTDTQAGQVVGQAIGRAMLATPAMQTALAEIRAELAPFLAADGMRSGE